VVGIADGDTLTVLDPQKTTHRVRLSGIDAPEMGQPYGKASKQNLSGLVFNKVVTVQYTKTDRWGRVVGKVLLDGLDVNLKQVLDGLAWHFKRYEEEQSPEDRRLYDVAEQQARREKRGLWKEPNAVPPWEWRAARR
jgi:endonuclease YncB( thermonuclease family)